ncbi:uncharacterized protein G6M90_00g064680 [Metarhizium brunneum]|uniref:BTB domain-containing protein n=1 Tax=Metarhizium brunneum TaxID=500148 RepID=A0A7D5Z4J3_9HYPO
MQEQTFELDPQGDVLLVLRRPNLQHLDWGQADEHATDEHGYSTDQDEEKEVRFRLSSRHLSLASPVFNTMLSGGWKESTISPQQPGTTSNEKIDKNDAALPLRYEITATEWDVNVFILLMNILHGHHREVPYSVDIETLARFSVLVDYYDCHEITEFFANIWIEYLQLSLPTAYGRDSTIWLFVSWVFSSENIFKQMTRLAMTDSQGPLETVCLPLPPELLTAIEKERTESVRKMIHLLGELHDDLLKGDKGCNFLCSSLLLGALMKGMDSNRIERDQDPESFTKYSVGQIYLILLGMESPVNYDYTPGAYGSYEPHTCTLKSMLKPKAVTIWTSLTGLWVGDYKAK